MAARRQSKITVLYISNVSGGFADYIECPAGTTAIDFFESQVDGDPARYSITINKEPAASDQVLQEGDRITISPVKVAAA